MTDDDIEAGARALCAYETGTNDYGFTNLPPCQQDAYRARARAVLAGTLLVQTASIREDAGAKMDAKFFGNLYKVKDGSLVPPDEWIAFLVKDNAVPPMLKYYRQACEQLGADAEQIAAIERMQQRCRVWRTNNPERCKVPDAAGERLLDQFQNNGGDT